MKISGIVCIHSTNNAIGYNNKLLFRLKDDMKFFKDTTTHIHDVAKQNAVLMGYNTFRSIPEEYFPLTNRMNIIISKNHYKEVKEYIKQKSLYNTYVFYHILNALQFCTTHNTLETLFVIGGSSIYSYFISKHLLHNLYISTITSPELNIGDTFITKKDKEIIDLNYDKQYISSHTEHNVLHPLNNQPCTVTYSIYRYSNNNTVPYTKEINTLRNRPTMPIIAI